MGFFKKKSPVIHTPMAKLIDDVFGFFVLVGLVVGAAITAGIGGICWLIYKVIS